MRDRGPSEPRVAKLWSEVKDYAEDEISAGARKKLKELLERGILDEFEQLIRSRR